VRRILAWNAVVALLLANLYASLFHLHTDGGKAPLLHAHLPEVESEQDESGVHVEPPHSHSGARSIDLLTTTTAQHFQLDAMLVSDRFEPCSNQPNCGFVPVATERSHDPPAIWTLIPRAPPA
jgi:hypothetical protein